MAILNWKAILNILENSLKCGLQEGKMNTLTSPVFLLGPAHHINHTCFHAFFVNLGTKVCLKRTSKPLILPKEKGTVPQQGLTFQACTACNSDQLMSSAVCDALIFTELYLYHKWASPKLPTGFSSAASQCQVLIVAFHVPFTWSNTQSRLCVRKGGRIL